MLTSCDDFDDTIRDIIQSLFCLNVTTSVIFYYYNFDYTMQLMYVFFFQSAHSFVKKPLVLYILLLCFMLLLF